MKDEYIIINKTAIQKRIEELDKEISILCRAGNKDWEITNIAIAKLYSEKHALNLFLSSIRYQSTPLIPEIEKAFDAGENLGRINCIGIPKREYIKNLKLNT